MSYGPFERTIVRVFLLAFYLSTAAFGTSRAAEKLALLVGCSVYEEPGIRALPGAANDTAQFEALLRERLGFQGVETLVGWPDDPAKRPTRANIAAAFERLITRAGPESQVVILLSGHGFRFPLPESQQDLLDPGNPEPDGLDEAFLPADYHAGQNMILDNQIAVWLDRLRERGAHTWIVFDSCHSGTMTRGGEQEVSRTLDAVSAGIAPEVIAAARRRATQRSTGAAETRQVEGLDVDSPAHKTDKGTVVAFYAAQDFETAPEVVRPMGAEEIDANRHGLLSFHLEQCLRQSARTMTYRELGRLLVSRYRADGRKNPTPFFEGDLDVEVLGFNEWPQPKPLFLEHVQNEVRLAAGLLAGIRDGAILGVHPPDDKEGRNLLGYVRVTQATPTAAALEPVEFGDKSPVGLKSLPEGAHCKLVSQTLDDTRLKVAMLDTLHAVSQETRESVLEALRILSQPNEGIIEWVQNPAQADWLLTAETPESARTKFNLESPEPLWLLLESNATEPASAHSSAHRLRGRYSVSDASSAAKRISDDLRKIFTWRTLWRVAGSYGEGSPLSQSQTVRLEVARLRGPEDTSEGIPLDTSRLEPGDWLSLRAVNAGYQSQWYAVFLLDERFAIHHVAAGSIAKCSREDNFKPQVREIGRVRIRGVGAQGCVLLAVSQKDHANQPDYRFLAQGALGEPKQRASADASRLTTPFERLLLGAVHGGSNLRGAASPDEPQIVSWSWTSVPSHGSTKVRTP